MRRRLLASAAAALLATGSGCGTAPREPGEPAAKQVLGYAHEARTLDARVSAVGAAVLHQGMPPGEARLALQETLLGARLLEEDIASQVPLGAPARAQLYDASRQVLAGASFMHSYVSGHAVALQLARAHLSGAGIELAQAGRVLAPHLTTVQHDLVSSLEAPPPLPR